MIATKVIRAGSLGFCMGVRRAVKLVRAEAERFGKVCTLGPLIHNPQALEDLSRLGVTILDENNLPENLRGVKVVIRAHGISPQAEDQLRRRGAEIVDATCPRVKANQMKAAALAKAGYRLFVAGEETHAEITGILGYAAASTNAATGEANGNAASSRVAADSAGEAAAKLRAETPTAKTALIGQTTISPEEYRAIGEAIARHFPDVEIIPSICGATVERQESLRELLDKVEAVIIAGGKKSANARRLLHIAQEAGKPCALVETAADITPDFTRYATIGLAAGASTPDTVIDEIEAFCLRR